MKLECNSTRALTWEALGLKWDQLSGQQQDIVLKELHRQENAYF